MARRSRSIKLQRSTAFAKEAAKMMRWIDPAIEPHGLRVLGQKHAKHGRWEDEVLEHTFEHVDYISLHVPQQLRR